MKTSTLRSFAKVTQLTLWCCFCFASFWDEPNKALLYSFAFGFWIWLGADHIDERISIRTYLLSISSFIAVIALLILIFQLSDFPPLSAGLLLALGAASAIFKLKIHRVQQAETSLPS